MARLRTGGAHIMIGDSGSDSRMLVAIGIYVGTNDLSMVPSGRQKQMPAGSRVP
jgi:inner membrane protein involved in colicin E2 resistance